MMGGFSSFFYTLSVFLTLCFASFSHASEVVSGSRNLRGKFTKCFIMDKGHMAIYETSAVEISFARRPSGERLVSFDSVESVGGAHYWDAVFVKSGMVTKNRYQSILPALPRMGKGDLGMLKTVVDLHLSAFVMDNSARKAIFKFSDESILSAVTPTANKNHVAIAYQKHGERFFRVTLIDVTTNQRIADVAVDPSVSGMDQLDWYNSNIIVAVWNGRRVSGCNVIDLHTGAVVSSAYDVGTWIENDKVLVQKESGQNNAEKRENPEMTVYPR